MLTFLVTVLMFGCSIGIFLVFAMLLIKGSKMLEQRKGVIKVDGVVGLLIDSRASAGLADAYRRRYAMGGGT